MNKTTSLLLLLIFLLAGCGGSGNDNAPNAAPTPTPQPTLTLEERAEFPAGQVENPIRMVIVPTEIVEQRIEAILTENNILRRVEPESALDDALADEDTFALLNQALQRDFGLTIANPDEMTTVSQLVDYVHTTIGGRVSAAIFDQTSLYVDVVFANDYADALTDLCNSGTGIASIPWLDGMTYQAAVAQSCGQPVLQIAVAADAPANFATGAEVTETAEATTPDETAPEVTAEATAEATPETASPAATVPDAIPLPDVDTFLTGQPGVMITDASIGITNLGIVIDRNYCRLGLNDFYSWFLPALLLERAGIDPLRDPAEIIDYDSVASLVAAVRGGDCALTGLPQSVFDSLDPDGLAVIETTLAFPYGILMMPVEIQLGVRLALADNLAALAQTEDSSRDLHLLLGQNAFLPVELGDFSDLEAFFAGYDFVELGS